MFFFKSKPKAIPSKASAPNTHSEAPLDHEALQGDVAVIEALRKLREMRESGPAQPA